MPQCTPNQQNNKKKKKIHVLTSGKIKKNEISPKKMIISVLSQCLEV
jgi:hypothetical protein